MFGYITGSDASIAGYTIVAPTLYVLPVSIITLTLIRTKFPGIATKTLGAI
jgi:hypothetical protein